MIDIHCHILPGIDDGPQQLEQAIGLARAAVAEGITTLIATPHHLNGRYNTPTEVMMQAVDMFKHELLQHRIPLRVEPGQEVHVHPGWIDEFYRGNLCTLANSRYMLLEFPARQVPPNLQDVLHELKVKGIIPILAHPERNSEVVNSIKVTNELLEQGVLFQITAHSIVGLFGKRVQKWCFHLCKKNQLHFISSDAHDVVRRNFVMQKSYDRIGKLFGDDVVEGLKLNALHVLEDRPMVTIGTDKVKRRPLMWF
ncbi:tyrosine-protein phosphatase [Paenibacillus sp. FA6]|uniref:tyrosine-protein phosphatase n=1 Tax=Paenibacillus sp. FA6 TaxID=3413029 RepID=UPI003F65FB9E